MSPCFALAAGLPAAASAQEWPHRPIRIIVAFGAGGGADIISRILGQSMQERLGQSVIIENRPGAGGIIGNEAVARADKDGYTFGMMTAGQIIAATLKKSMRYDTLADFDPVSLVATASLMIVARPDFPANTVKDLVAAAKADPGKIVFASSGFGATQHFVGRAFHANRRRQDGARTLPQLAGGDLCGPRQAGGCAVRYGLGIDWTGSVR